MNGYSEVKRIGASLFNSDENSRLFKKKFVLHDNFDAWINLNSKKRKSIITTGIGLNREPHIGTIYQILNAIFLQKIGFNVQLVLGDLDVYFSRDSDLESSKTLANRYLRFVKRLGFNDKIGTLRTQSAYLDALKTSVLISKYATTKEILGSLDTIGSSVHSNNPKLPFKLSLSPLLMCGDFLDPYFSHGIGNICIMSGIDEHTYSKLARLIVIHGRIQINLSGLYSFLIRGFNGNIKMSKSFASSAISTDMRYEDIKNKLVSEAKRKCKDPEYESLPYRMMCGVSSYSSKELDSLKTRSLNGGREWEESVLSYLDNHLTPILKKW